MLIFSHRGYHACVPANTYEAFEQAVALGVDGIETDVRLSADGKLILFHDRLTPDGRTVGTVHHHDLSRCVGYEVPLLETVLRRWQEVWWNLEIKTPAVVEALCVLLGHLPRARGYLLTSFWHPVVEEVGQRLEAECGVLVAHRPFTMVDPPLGWWPAQRRVNTVVWDYELLDPVLLQQTTACGLRNMAYGPETPQEHRRCVDLELDGIITDHPDLLLPKSDSSAG
jgi:glycerophosphoryl diester phosphodiesterase